MIGANRNLCGAAPDENGLGRTVKWNLKQERDFNIIFDSRFDFGPVLYCRAQSVASHTHTAHAPRPRAHEGATCISVYVTRHAAQRRFLAAGRCKASPHHTDGTPKAVSTT